MKKFVFRLLAYLSAGLSFGPAARLLMFDATFDDANDAVIAVAAGIAITGMVLVLWFAYKAGFGRACGIRINPRWTVAAMDVICIIAAAIAVFFIVDGYSHEYFGLVRGMTDPLLADVIAFMFVPATLVLALFVTTSAGQSVEINDYGVTVTGAFGVQQAAWEQITRLEADAQYVAVSRLQTPVPSKLRTNLEIFLGDDETITVYQPGLKSTARQILARLKQHAPERLLGGISNINAAWK